VTDPLLYRIHNKHIGKFFESFDPFIGRWIPNDVLHYTFPMDKKHVTARKEQISEKDANAAVHRVLMQSSQVQRKLIQAIRDAVDRTIANKKGVSSDVLLKNVVHMLRLIEHNAEDKDRAWALFDLPKLSDECAEEQLRGEIKSSAAAFPPEAESLRQALMKESIEVFESKQGSAATRRAFFSLRVLSRIFEDISAWIIVRYVNRRGQMPQVIEEADKRIAQKNATGPEGVMLTSANGQEAVNLLTALDAKRATFQISIGSVVQNKTSSRIGVCIKANHAKVQSKTELECQYLVCCIIYALLKLLFISLMLRCFTHRLK
jgi:hypothetical protein